MRTLCLDFDKPVDSDQLDKLIDIVADATQVSLLPLSLHPTARGCHALVRATGRIGAVELTPMEVVALQLLLGSDPMREAYNFQRARILGDAPTFWQEMHRWNVDYSEKL